MRPTMEPLSIAITLFTSTAALAHTIGTGSLGDSYTLALYSWKNIQTDIRGEFVYRRTRRYEAPKFNIVGDSTGTFLSMEEYGIRDDDGRIEIVWTQESDATFVISQASRENWKCEIPGANGVLTRISKLADFRLMVIGTIPVRSLKLESLGGYSRLYIKFPGSCFALSPCNSQPDTRGQNILGTRSESIPRTEAAHLRPAVMKGSSVFPSTARVILQPQRVNWVYWDADKGFGPTLEFDGYCADPLRRSGAPTK